MEESSGDFESKYGVTYRSYLRDGEDFTGRAKKEAHKLALEQEEADEELFLAYGGIEKVRRRLLAKWDDESQSLTKLTRAEERMMVIIGLEGARLAAFSVTHLGDVFGYGLLATRKIRASEYVGEYTGVLRRSRPEDLQNRYLAQSMPYGEFADFVIDGQDEGNFMRFINHSSEAANVQSQHVFHDLRWHYIIRALRDLAPGEQLLLDYGQDYWRNRELPAEL